MHDRDLERTQDLTIGQYKRIEIVYDENIPTKVELYHVNSQRRKIGGWNF